MYAIAAAASAACTDARRHTPQSVWEYIARRWDIG